MLPCTGGFTLIEMFLPSILTAYMLLEKATGYLKLPQNPPIRPLQAAIKFY